MRPLSGQKWLSKCSRVNKSWRFLCLPLLHQCYFRQRIHPRLEWLCKPSQLEWGAICFLAYSALHSTRWGLGQLRLFWIEDECLDVMSLIRKFPNPRHPYWDHALSCSMDVQQVFMELATGRPVNQNHGETDVSDLDFMQMITHPSGRMAPGQTNIPIMLRQSERMDQGSFLLFHRLISCPSQFILLRVKPTGIQTHSRCETGNGKMVIWDTMSYGACSRCKVKLEKIQVCANCKVLQYCGRDCQRQDWESGHRDHCQDLAFKHL